MSELVPFDFEGHPVRVVAADGEPWLIAADACGVLSIRDTSSALKMVDPEDIRRFRRSDTPHIFGGIAPQVQEITVVNESGLYALIFHSRKPEARRFKRWVTHEVLPTIRKTGRYEVEAATPSLPDLSTVDGQLAVIDLLRDQVERRQRLELENAGLAQENTEMRPKVNAADAMRHWDGAYRIGTVAQMFGLGQNTLFGILYDEQILRRDNRRPYQRYLPWFRVVATPRDVRDEHGKLIRVVTDYTTHIYPDGALRLHHLLTSRGYELHKPRLSSELPLFALEAPKDDNPGGSA